MISTNNEEKKEIKIPPVPESSVPENAGQNPAEQKDEAEQKELLKDELSHQQIREKLENMDASDAQKAQAQTVADEAKDLPAQAKIQQLLKVAKDKGVIVAVQAAKKMNDPYVLDMLHDVLAKEGYYKSFIK